VTGVRLLADDLSGALDAGACFSRRGQGLPVVWDAPPGSGSYSFDTESRELVPDIAERLVAGLAPALAQSGIAFKKVDSLLRGNTVGEIAACLESGVFASAVIAPAFPALGRITRCGRQLVRTGSEWEALPVALGDVLGRRGLAPRHRGRGAPPEGRGVFLCDAESEEDLAALAGAAAELARPTLWCGSAGLARALAGDFPPVPLLEAGALLTIVGSDHPTSAMQAQSLPSEALVALANMSDAATAAHRLGERLAARRQVALVFRLPPMPRDEARRCIADALAEIVASVPRPDAIVATGGETAFSLCRALRADGLTALGWTAPGIPLSRVEGGLWPGLPFVTKSGAFGSPATLRQLTLQISGGAIA
jgi:D-threonate/D-erythronate kinase